MMSSPLLLQLLVVAVVLAPSTMAITTTYAPHVMFNEGQLDLGMYCSTAEWNLITDALMARYTIFCYPI
jgi:hypothetical protein